MNTKTANFSSFYSPPRFIAALMLTCVCLMSAIVFSDSNLVYTIQILNVFPLLVNDLISKQF